MPVPTSPSKNVDHKSLRSSPALNSVPQLAQLERLLASTSPGMFAQLVTEGAWRPARHLAYLDTAIAQSIDAAAAGKQEGLVVSMPPQHGKSELCSKYLPAWYLGVHPDRRVILTSYEADFAASWGRKARDLLDQHGQLFGVRVSRSSSAASRWEIEGLGGGMMTAGVGGPITGKGAHLLDRRRSDQERRRGTQRQRPAAAMGMVAVGGYHTSATWWTGYRYSDPLASR